MMTLGRTAALAAALLGFATTAWAQGNPSADQIINSLRPTGNMMGGTRGIRPVTPATPTAPPADVAPAAAPAATPGGAAARPHRPAPATTETRTSPPSVDLSVQFASGSAELTPAAVTTLTALGQALSSATLGSYRFRIEGHTDTVGSPESNKALSDRRAQAVASFLETRFHIDPARLEAVGMGQDGLLVQTPPDVAEPRNRRVQVINLGT